MTVQLLFFISHQTFSVTQSWWCQILKCFVVFILYRWSRNGMHPFLSKISLPGVSSKINVTSRLSLQSNSRFQMPKWRVHSHQRKCLSTPLLKAFSTNTSIDVYFLPVSLCSMGLSWMLDLRTQLCIFTSGPQTSWMEQAWSPSTLNAMLRVRMITFSTNNHKSNGTNTPTRTIECWIWKVYDSLSSESLTL